MDRKRKHEEDLTKTVHGFQIPDAVINPRFKDTPTLRPDFTEDIIKTDFRDNELLSQPAISLYRLTDDQTAVLGRSIIPMFRSGFSQSGVAALFLLAYQLKDPYQKGSYIFPENTGLDQADDKMYDEMNMVTGTHQQLSMLSITSDVRTEATIYSYIAASTFRLFIKSEDAYLKSYNQIISGFHRFYSVNIRTILPSPPNIDPLMRLTIHFRRGEIFKNTLFRFLYLGSGDTRAAGLKKFLYENYLENTGIHIFNIFNKLTNVLGCSPALLLSVIYSRQYELQLSALQEMLQLMTSKQAGHARKMWRFGRLFDDDFMYHLKAKSCPCLTYILASALKGESPEENQDILNIKQLEDIRSEDKLYYEVVGKRIVKAIREQEKA